ncbi:MAG: hypothetical protein Q8Q90_01775, partial [bacterium]|nr:hypothetical protein [bacterium]
NGKKALILGSKWSILTKSANRRFFVYPAPILTSDDNQVTVILFYQILLFCITILAKIGAGLKPHISNFF